mgnify:CR=1 FL=1
MERCPVRVGGSSASSVGVGWEWVWNNGRREAHCRKQSLPKPCCDATVDAVSTI